MSLPFPRSAAGAMVLAAPVRGQAADVADRQDHHPAHLRPSPRTPVHCPAHRPTAAPRSPQRVGPPPRPLPPPRVALTPRLCGACAGLSCGGAAAWRTGRTTPAAPRTPPRTAAGASFIMHTLPHTLPLSPISPTTPITLPLHFPPSPRGSHVPAHRSPPGRANGARLFSVVSFSNNCYLLFWCA